MAKGSESRSTFSEILKAEHAHGVEPRRPACDGADDAGRGLVLVNTCITPERAHELVLDGAAVAWDYCGSRGWAGEEVVWFDEAEVQRLAAAGPPTLRRKKNRRGANLMEYRREDGRPVVIAEMSVRWGDLMD